VRSLRKSRLAGPELCSYNFGLESLRPGGVVNESKLWREGDASQQSYTSPSFRGFDSVGLGRIRFLDMTDTVFVRPLIPKPFRLGK
jgi:hypothetical protein